MALASFICQITNLEDGDHALYKVSYRHCMAKAIAGQPEVIGDVPNPCVRDDRIVLPDIMDFRGVDWPIRRRLPQVRTSTSPAILRNRQPWSDRERHRRIQDHQPAC